MYIAYGRPDWAGRQEYRLGGQTKCHPAASRFLAGVLVSFGEFRRVDDFRRVGELATFGELASFVEFAIFGKSAEKDAGEKSRRRAVFVIFLQNISVKVVQSYV